jgi:transposase
MIVLERPPFEPDIVAQLRTRLTPSDTPMPNTADRVEVFSGVQRRRRYSLDRKLAVLAVASQPGMSISFIARKQGISPSLLFGWRRRITEGGKEAVRVDDEVVASSEARAREEAPGEQDLREALKIAPGKKSLSRICRRYPKGIRGEAGC